jgi:hypothetical protein
LDLDSGSSSVVQHLAHNPKIEGTNPSTDTGRELLGIMAAEQ